MAADAIIPPVKVGRTERKSIDQMGQRRQSASTVAGRPAIRVPELRAQPARAGPELIVRSIPNPKQHSAENRADV